MTSFLADSSAWIRGASGGAEEEGSGGDRMYLRQ